MQLKVIAAIAAVFTFVVTSAAEARKHPHNDSDQQDNADDDDDRRSLRKKRSNRQASEERSEPRRTNVSRRRNADDDGDGDSRSGRHSGVGAKPGAWCGWYMRTRHGGGPELNLAANWRHYGRPSSPKVGAIVVWDHHVGEIVGKADNGQWIILSGNDGNAVKRRPRSISGATIRA